MIQIDGNSLTFDTVELVARNREKVEFSSAAIAQIHASNQRLNKIMRSDKPVYGINTGFGLFSNRSIPSADIDQLNRNLILSHAVGTGKPLDEEVVRAAMLIRANTLAKGYSGIRLEVLSSLLEMINKGVTPVVPSQGSLGSSGDLCQLSHMALILTRDDADLESESGQAVYENSVYSGKAAMQMAGIPRIVLGPKEGLALNNGATFSTAIAALAVPDAERLLLLSVLSLALTLEAVRGCSNAFDPRIQQVRNQRGQLNYSKMIEKLIRGSKWLDASKRVQDAYSLRCAPQVCGAVLDTIQFVKGIIASELNAATDNPLIFDSDVAISGGNFHGEPVGLAMDYLKIALSELCAISERRIHRLLDPALNDGLPAMLVDKDSTPGLNSGLMMPHYTAVSLTLENQALANPDSTRSLPTSGGQEDHNANAMTAARHAREVAQNTLHVLAIEMHTACQAIQIRESIEGRLGLGDGTRKFYEALHQQDQKKKGDRLWAEEIDRIKSILGSSNFIDTLKNDVE